MTENGPSDSQAAGPDPRSDHSSAPDPEQTRQAAGEFSAGAARDSEERFRKLFESTGDAIMLLGSAGFLECNQATLRLFRCRTREEFISKHPSELSPPTQPDGIDSRTAADNRIARAFSDGTHRFEWMHRREDGTDFMADVLLARVDLSDGSILQAVVRDISRQKQVEQELRDAHEQLEQRVEERTVELASANEELKREVVERRRAEQDLALERFLLTTLMEHAPDFIFFKDRHSRIIRISKALADFYGLSCPEEAIGKTDRDFFDAERANRYAEDEKEIMRTGRIVVDKEEDQQRDDGSVTWRLTNRVPLYNPHGEIMGTFGISRDITRRKQAASQLRAAMEEAEAASRAKSDFLANMSHEIRTPMNAIIGMTELVLDTPLTDAQREYLQMVRDSSDALLAVINDILDFSKVEAGKLELDLTTFDMREVLGDTMKALALRAHGKGLELVCQVRPGVPQWLIGDAGRLRQIVLNLVGNAIKFTEKGEVLLSVECQAVRNEQATLQFRVIDTGIGIAPAKQEVVFHAFEQADNSTTRRFGGTGLGLTICSRLVHAMGGEIGVRSELGSGSTFHFTLQLGIATDGPGPANARQPGLVEGTRVLLVDDNETNLLILVEMLRNWHMCPETSSTVAEALDKLRIAQANDQAFDLILTDANMPHRDGFDLAHEVQTDRLLKNTLIMMLSSGGRSTDVSRCEELGIATYLLKPVKQSELFDAIGSALGLATTVDAVPIAAAPANQFDSLYILLAEDSLVNQRLAVGLLEKAGHRVDVVSDGRAAVDAVRTNHYDLVLMDVQMPELDGLEATEIIRNLETPHRKHTPIVAMTAHAMKGDRERCLKAGMDGYVAKPIRAKDVFQTIEDVLKAMG